MSRRETVAPPGFLCVEGQGITYLRNVSGSELWYEPIAMFVAPGGAVFGLNPMPIADVASDG